ncbi:hypothetical protein KIW84_030563, partial [Lathyrus oleraceus]
VSLDQATAYELLAHSSTGTRSEPQLLPLLGSLRFHVLFHSPPGVLFTFPSRYYFTIGHPGVFSLARWSLLIHTGFHVPHVDIIYTILSKLSTSKEVKINSQKCKLYFE